MRYLILGATEVRDERGQPVPVGGARLRALLACLALRPGRAVPLPQVIDEVWAERPPHDGVNAVQALVSRLRRMLGRSAITAQPGGYRLHAEPDDVDLHRFERLTAQGRDALEAGDPTTAATLLNEALTLWRGPALADLPGGCSAAARTEALRLTALHSVTEARLALGGHAEALHPLEELVAEHPLHEPFRVQLIRALRATGRQADALAAYEQARTDLAERLGADPGPALQALHHELLAGSDAPAAPPATAPRPGNLRPRLTSFVGREPDLRALRDELTAARLVTLTGPGGSGKTRLSEEASRALQPGFPDGAWIAELASVDHPAAVPDAVLSALGGRATAVYTPRDVRGGPQEVATADPTIRLLDHCAQRRLLLVLDNCEHVIGAAASLVEALLAACPAVTVLATSREPLGVPGEVVRPVEPLPPHTAHHLFTDRATAVQRGFDPRGEQKAVAEICRRLDGLPLAIELAAARLRILSPRQIADRLDDRFRLLTAGSRTAVPRQQTLRAVVDWSWDLLSEPERALMRRLSVFSGGCTLEAAEAVCSDGEPGGIARSDVLDLLGALVDKSLVVAERARDTSEDGFRYRMLETIHEYAVEKARGIDDSEAAARRHIAYVRDLARTADPQLRTAGQLVWFARLEAEHDNIRAALRRCLAARDEEHTLAIAVAMSWFWALRNYANEAMSWLTEALALSDQAGDSTGGGSSDSIGDGTDDSTGDSPDDPLYWPRTEARLYLLFVSADRQSEAERRSERSRRLATQVIEAYRAQGPYAARMPGAIWAFAVWFLGPKPGELVELMDRAVSNIRRYGGRWEQGMALVGRCLLSTDERGSLERGERDLDEARELLEAVGDRWAMAQRIGASAEMAAVRGHYARAREGFEEALRLSEELGAGQERAFLLARLADVAFRSGDSERADKLLRSADEEIERYAVWDTRTYIRFLRSAMALRSGQVEQARALAELARRDLHDGTPPPMFEAFIHGLSGRIRLAEGHGEKALAEIREALHFALDHQSEERLVSTLLEWAALTLTSLGSHRQAALLMGAAAALRGGLPRPVPEEEDAEEVRRRVRAALGEELYAAELAAGAELRSREAFALTGGDPAQLAALVD